MKLRFLPIIIGLLFLSVDSLQAAEAHGHRRGGWHKGKATREINLSIIATFEEGSLPPGLPVTLEGPAFEPAERLIAAHPVPLTPTRKAMYRGLIAANQSISYKILIFSKGGGHTGKFEQGSCGPIPADYQAGKTIQMTFSKTNAAAADEPQYKCALTLK